MSRQGYEELSMIGRGAYGTVFKALDIENNRTVALKRVRIVNTGEDKGVPVSTLREITLLKQLDNVSHPNIVRMFDAFQTYPAPANDASADVILTIVFEHVEQDLSTFLRSCPPPGLPESLIKDLMHQLLSGVDYLHVNRLVHRDMKPQNVLITKDRQVKIADFGLARVYGFCKAMTSLVVTLWYRAPEILLQAPYATSVDIWSVGAIMAEMYNKRPLFPGKTDVDQLHKVLSVIGSPSREDWPESVPLPWENFSSYNRISIGRLLPEISDEGVSLIENMLVFKAGSRLTARQALLHPYFDDVREQCSQDSGTDMNTSASHRKAGATSKSSFSYARDDVSYSDKGVCPPAAELQGYSRLLETMSATSPGASGGRLDASELASGSVTLQHDLRVADMSAMSPGSETDTSQSSRADSGISVSPSLLCSGSESSSSSLFEQKEEVSQFCGSSKQIFDKA